ncbi:MAG TPA: GAF domain-containing protein [Gammaproteobacteria bacterium]|jgi:GAF domain-containing protein|nr:GAF domain-containing protein [Gammaproteobacteria bacterium]
MFEMKAVTASSKPELYAEIVTQVQGLLHDEHDLIANAANLSALLYHALPDVNWVGFYFLKEGELLVGPFQGKPACVRIAMGKGVCGAAAVQRESIVVPDVNTFPGHVFCDGNSRSEVVVPLVKADKLLGVLDIDSPSLARFDAEDRAGLETVAAIFLAALD